MERSSNDSPLCNMNMYMDLNELVEYLHISSCRNLDEDATSGFPGDIRGRAGTDI